MSVSPSRSLRLPVILPSADLRGSSGYLQVICNRKALFEWTVSWISSNRKALFEWTVSWISSDGCLTEVILKLPSWSSGHSAYFFPAVVGHTLSENSPSRSSLFRITSAKESTCKVTNSFTFYKLGTGTWKCTDIVFSHGAGIGGNIN
jgi:hypothetical protein